MQSIHNSTEVRRELSVIAKIQQKHVWERDEGKWIQHSRNTWASQFFCQLRDFVLGGKSESPTAEYCKIPESRFPNRQIFTWGGDVRVCVCVCVYVHVCVCVHMNLLVRGTVFAEHASQHAKPEPPGKTKEGVNKNWECQTWRHWEGTPDKTCSVGNALGTSKWPSPRRTGNEAQGEVWKGKGRDPRHLPSEHNWGWCPPTVQHWKP
jgi:hypothetical protein